MANGKVITGYSKPYVALYASSNNTVTYSGGMPLARGVDVSVEPETGDAVNFYADNVLAESVGGVFTGATITMTVDGLKDAARKLIMGLPDAETVTVGQSQSVQVYKYDDRQVIPNVGIGFVIRYMESGVTSYQPVVFTKASFNVDGIEAATQEEEIEFQTTELEAALMRDDSTNHVWRIVGEEQTTEASAEAVVRALLNITGA
jgi:phi13 family phage major tail protein